MKKIHFTDRYLLNPRHPVTVFVIGAGGTGSQVITNLARMSMALQALGHPGLHVTVFDPDTVSQANIGRQLFSETELGLNKAVSLVTRINRFFGRMDCRTAMLPHQELFWRKHSKYHHYLYGQYTFTSYTLEVPEESPQRKLQ